MSAPRRPGGRAERKAGRDAAPGARAPRTPGVPGRLTRAAPPRVARWIALPSALLVTVLVHQPALRTFFAQDDLVFLARAAGIEPAPVSWWRVLSGTPRWKLFYALFGVNPLPYHVANLLFHLVNVALVYAVARRLFPGRQAAWTAATLFGVSAIAFTPLHWATGFTEILAATFALLGLLLYLVARGAGAGMDGEPRERPVWLWVSAAAVLAAGLSKESMLLLPLVLVFADRRLGGIARRGRSLVPAGVAGLLFALSGVATLRLPEHLGGEAYALDPSPDFVVRNLATYLRWTVALWDPIRDAFAQCLSGATPVGLAVAAGALLVLMSQWRARRHPEELGAFWFLALLAPVVPLAHHTYLYYLYVPWAGACWLAAGAASRLARRVPAALPAVLAVTLAFAAIEAWSVRAREVAMTGRFATDRTILESTLLRNAVAALDTVPMAPGTRVVFANPAPRERSSTADQAGRVLFTYNPLEVALRGGLSLRVLRPGVRCLGVVDTIPPGWADVEVFLYQPDGSARHLGRGSRAEAGLGYFTMRTEQWALAERMFLRSLALGDTLPDAIFGLGITRVMQGREDEARAYAEEGRRRWPHDPRAPAILEGLRRDRTAR